MRRRRARRQRILREHRRDGFVDLGFGFFSGDSLQALLDGSVPERLATARVVNVHRDQSAVVYVRAIPAPTAVGSGPSPAPAPSPAPTIGVGAFYDGPIAES